MNFKFKALVVAAIAATTMSGAAHALTNNEIFLVAYDSTTSAEKTFVASLGALGNVSTFTGTSNFSKDFSTDSNWTSFYGAGANAANIKWSVLGAYAASAPSTDYAGSYYAGDKIVFTQAPTSAVPSTISNLTLNNITGDLLIAGGNMKMFYSLNSSVTGNTTGIVNGVVANSGYVSGSDFFGQFSGINSLNSLGSNSNFYAAGRPDDGSVLVDDLDKATPVKFVNGAAVGDLFSLSSAGVLTYTNVAAVPEADSSAMILAGMGLIGFIARRRRIN